MRAIAGLSALGLMGFIALFVIPQFLGVVHTLEADQGKLAEEAPLLENVAPELAALRPAFQAIANRAFDLAPYCYGRNAWDDRPLVHGKALVWDVATNDFSPAHLLLPKELQAVDPHEDCTVFLVLKQEKTRLDGDYFENAWGPPKPGEKGLPSYRIDSEIVVATIPDATPRCWFRLQGKSAPGMIELKTEMKEVVGSWTDSVVDFVVTSMQGTGPKRSVASLDKLRLLVDKARPAIPLCSASQSLPKDITSKAIIWDAQRNFPHEAYSKILPSHAYLESINDDCLVVFVTAETFVPANEGNGGRYDLAVKLVQLPGAVPLGSFTLRGDDWPDPRQIGQEWTHRNLNEPLRHWVDKLYHRPTPKSNVSIFPTQRQPLLQSPYQSKTKPKLKPPPKPKPKPKPKSKPKSPPRSPPSANRALRP